MVLVGRQEVFTELRRDRALAALITLLFDHNASLDVPNRISQTSDAVVGMLASLRNGKDDGFRQATAMLIRRKVRTDSDWIHDDLLAFSLVVGNLRFGGSDELVNQLLNARFAGTDVSSQMMSRSLSALANSRDDAPLAAVLVIGRMLADPEMELNGPLLSHAYEQSAELENQPATQQFLRLIGEKVADLAIRIGTLKNTTDYSRLKAFQSKFDARANVFSGVVYWLLLLGVAALWLSIARLYFSPDKQTEDLAGKLFQMGVVVAPSVLLFARKQIRAGVRRLFYRIFGGGGLLEITPEKKV